MKHPIDALGDAIVDMRGGSVKHHIDRTSPKGGPFRGTCRLCGTPGLTIEQVNDDCPNQRGLSSAEALVEAITGEPFE
jgi:hypothetical protein